jgi:hypothetical protein
MDLLFMRQFSCINQLLRDRLPISHIGAYSPPDPAPQPHVVNENGLMVPDTGIEPVTF